MVRRRDRGETYGLIADDPGRSVGGPGVASPKPHVTLSSNHEERSLHSEPVEPVEAQVGPIHDVERAWLRRDLIEHVHFMPFSLGNMKKCRDVAAQIQQRVDFDGGLRLAEPRPRKQGETKIDHRRVESVEGVIEFDSKRIVGMERPCDTDQGLRAICNYRPIPILVGIGQCRARNCSAEAHVVELAAHGMEARFDISQAFSVSQLGEGHRQKLIPAREPLQIPVTAVAGDTFLKVLVRSVRHQLGENGAASVHGPLSTPPKKAWNALAAVQIVPPSKPRYSIDQERVILVFENVYRTLVIRHDVETGGPSKVIKSGDAGAEHR